MSYSTIQDDPSYLFTIRFRLRSGWVTIRAWEQPRFKPNGQPRHPNDTHSYLDAELTHLGKVVFPRGATWCGVASGHAIDGIEAKELVTSLFAIKPGDTDDEYFEGYTPEQRAWAETFGEELDCLKDERYCDPETGEVRRSA